jgi:hypothetical protein
MVTVLYNFVFQNLERLRTHRKADEMLADQGEHKDTVPGERSVHVCRGG